MIFVLLFGNRRYKLNEGFLSTKFSCAPVFVLSLLEQNLPATLLQDQALLALLAQVPCPHTADRPTAAFSYALRSIPDCKSSLHLHRVGASLAGRLTALCTVVLLPWLL